MTKTLIFLFTFSVILTSCSENRKSRSRKDNTKYKESLINYLQCFTDQESNISFPIWFNDTIIKQKKIKSIKRSFLIGETISGLEEIRTYRFDENGVIESFLIKEIYDNSEVSTTLVEYKEGVDENGFAPAKLSRMNDFSEANSFDMYQKETNSDKYVVYKDISEGSYLFFMKNKKNWGSISVDSILHPTPEDIVVYGMPKKFSKRYQVNNTVNEFNVMNVEYKAKHDVVAEILFDEAPFEYKRTLNYDKNGTCKGFIDSTFSASNYIMRKVTTIIYNDQNLPKTIKHVNHVQENVDGHTESEKFEYEFYN